MHQLRYQPYRIQGKSVFRLALPAICNYMTLYALLTQKSFLDSPRILFLKQYFCNLNFTKIFSTCALGLCRTESTSLTWKSSSSWLGDVTFIAHWHARKIRLSPLSNVILDSLCNIFELLLSGYIPGIKASFRLHFC